MAIKESSDEFNRTLLTAVAVGPKTATGRSAKDYLALVISSCGVGYLPLAPGTWGSLVGVGLYLLLWAGIQEILFTNAALQRFTLLQVWTPAMTIMLLAILGVTMAGIWAATRVERVLQRKDPGLVVVDEVAGQMIALLSGPFFLHTWWSVLTAFLLFRAFDIWKPYPIRRLESLESGLGVMADDVLAGIYALIANSVLISLYLLFFPGGG
jgi:phosphatidylglycerophosphatase A